MTTPIPVRKAAELITSINEMLFNGANDERIKEIVSAADKLKKFGQYTDAYIVLGMIAALRADSSEVDRFFKAAINSGGRSVETLVNYAAALSNIDKLRDSVAIIDEVIELVPDDLSLIKKAIKLHFDAFDTNGVRELIARYEALGQPFNDPWIENQLTAIDALMTEHNVTWSDLASRIEFAASVLHRLGFATQNGHQIDENGVLIYEFKINGDVDSISHAECVMNDTISEEPYSPIDDFLYLSCSAI